MHHLYRQRRRPFYYILLRKPFQHFKSREKSHSIVGKSIIYLLPFGQHVSHTFLLQCQIVGYLDLEHFNSIQIFFTTTNFFARIQQVSVEYLKCFQIRQDLQCLHCWLLVGWLWVGHTFSKFVYFECCSVVMMVYQIFRVLVLECQGVRVLGCQGVRVLECQSVSV